MELATGIQLDQGIADCTDGANLLFIKLAELSSRGLPKCTGKTFVYSFDFRDFILCSFNEYARSFGSHLKNVSKHSTWSVIHQGTRFVIPALALIRAFLHSRKTLFHIIFQPQSLDDVCTYSGKSGEAGIRLSDRFTSIQRRSLKYVGTTLSWFSCFPSARRAWASIFQAAKEGSLHFELPLAMATFKLAGMRVNDCIFVTDLTLQAIDCHEQPFDFASAHPVRITKVSGRRASKASSPDTYVRLTEAEWIHIRNELDSVRYTRRPGTYDRSVIEAILMRLSCKIGWSIAGQINNVSVDRATSAYRRWQSDGRLDRVLAKLCELRVNGKDAEKFQNRFNSHTVISFQSQKLSQAEWEAVKNTLGPRTGTGKKSLTYRTILDSLWVQRSSSRIYPKAMAKMTSLPLEQIRGTFSRWRADGRFDRVMVQLRALESAVDENSKLTDAQWQALVPLISPLHSDPYKDNRLIFNCILEKLSSEISWENVAHRHGLNLHRVKSSRRLWKTDGRFDRALAQLHDMRAST